MDAHSWWPLFENIPSEYLETYYPLTVLEYGSLIDSGGAGFHRGGNGVHKVYRFEADGEIAIHDDRRALATLGHIWGGGPGTAAAKRWCAHQANRSQLPSKVSCVKVRRGDVLIYQTAGGGGWKDPLDRPAESVQTDVRCKLVSLDKGAGRLWRCSIPAESRDTTRRQPNNCASGCGRIVGRQPSSRFGPVPQAIGVQRSEPGKPRAS